jgi:hypothetical protein
MNKKQTTVLLGMASLAAMYTGADVHFLLKPRRKKFEPCNKCGKLTRDETCFTCQQKSFKAQHAECGCSTGIHDALTFGRGELDGSGFWEFPCWECAREHERLHPDAGPCWPHTDEDLDAMFPERKHQ